MTNRCMKANDLSHSFSGFRINEKMAAMYYCMEKNHHGNAFFSFLAINV